MCLEAFDLERYDPLKGFRDYVMDLVGVHYVRNIGEGVRGGASEDPEVCWHDPRDGDVR